MNQREVTRRRAMKLTATGASGAGLFLRTERVAEMQTDLFQTAGKPIRRAPSFAVLKRGFVRVKLWINP